MRKPLVASEGDARRFDPFRVLSREDRQRHLDAYRSHLEVRDGEIDLPQRRLSRREHYFRELDASPVAASHAVDRDGFFEHLQGAGSSPINEATAWLVAVAKANEGEVYGVNLELRRFERDKRFIRDGRFVEEGADTTDVAQLYVFLEELYHSRLLVEVCRTCGFDLEIQGPRWRIRMLSRLIYHLSDRIRWIVILCAEVVGATAFRLFVERCTLFAGEPAVEERLRSLVSEIWRDEVLHVAMLRARLGPVAVRVARRLLPAVVSYVIRDVPELLDLGGDRGEFLRRARQGIDIPQEIDWLEPDRIPAV